MAPGVCRIADCGFVAKSSGDLARHEIAKHYCCTWCAEVTGTRCRAKKTCPLSGRYHDWEEIPTTTAAPASPSDVSPPLPNEDEEDIEADPDSNRGSKQSDSGLYDQPTNLRAQRNKAQPFPQVHSTPEAHGSAPQGLPSENLQSSGDIHARIDAFFGASASKFEVVDVLQSESLRRNLKYADQVTEEEKLRNWGPNVYDFPHKIPFENVWDPAVTFESRIRKEAIVGFFDQIVNGEVVIWKPGSGKSSDSALAAEIIGHMSALKNLSAAGSYLMNVPMEDSLFGENKFMKEPPQHIMDIFHGCHRELVEANICPKYAEVDLHNDEYAVVATNFLGRKFWLVYPPTEHNTAVLSRHALEQRRMQQCLHELQHGIILEQGDREIFWIPPLALHFTATVEGSVLCSYGLVTLESLCLRLDQVTNGFQCEFGPDKAPDDLKERRKVAESILEQSKHFLAEGPLEAAIRLAEAWVKNGAAITAQLCRSHGERTYITNFWKKQLSVKGRFECGLCPKYHEIDVHKADCPACGQDVDNLMEHVWSVHLFPSRRTNKRRAPLAEADNGGRRTAKRLHRS